MYSREHFERRDLMVDLLVAIGRSHVVHNDDLEDRLFTGFPLVETKIVRSS